MSNQNNSEREGVDGGASSLYPFVTIFLSLLAIGATYLLSNSDLDMSDKTKGFSAVIVVYLCVCALLYFFQIRRKPAAKLEKGVFAVDIERTLGDLDDASSYFTGALRSADAFRLVSSRVKEICPYQTIVLFLLDESRTKLTSVHTDGESADDHKGQILDLDEGLAGQAYKTHQVEVDGYMMLDSDQDYGSSAAIPLRHGDNVFGVIQLFFGQEYDVEATEPTVFEAVGIRIAPLMLGAISYERTQANALTDITTDLPNERAFYLVLENQVAEAQRKRDDRPLTVLAIDIKNFTEINCTFGHVAGDKVLNFVASVVKDNLRTMDFVARALNDEFLVILPTANKEIAHEIMTRIHTGFFGRKLAINDTQAVEIELNIGWSAFGGDGETPGQLLSLAQLRKEHMKSTGPSNVIWFPQELAN